jgi:hypothetical protein
MLGGWINNGWNQNFPMLSLISMFFLYLWGNVVLVTFGRGVVIVLRCAATGQKEFYCWVLSLLLDVIPYHKVYICNSLVAWSRYNLINIHKQWCMHTVCVWIGCPCWYITVLAPHSSLHLASIQTCLSKGLGVGSSVLHIVLLLLATVFTILFGTSSASMGYKMVLLFLL